ncbi:MAG: AMP-binding protein, partial [Clostridia bacterium]|nr:AMP-binding protein [Clostridia bacterium]
MDAIKQIARRLREIRLISGKTEEEMANLTGITAEQYIAYEGGESDFSLTFLNTCANIFSIDLTSLITGEESKLSTFSIVRAGEGLPLDRRKGFKYHHLASYFKGRMSEPLIVNAPYSSEEHSLPIRLTSHAGEEFDYILSGSLRISIDGHEDVLHPGDAVYYDSGKPHGMIAESPEGCEFLAIITDDQGHAYEYKPAEAKKPVAPTVRGVSGLLADKFISCKEDSEGRLESIEIVNEENYNFAFDTIDAIAEKKPEKLALLHIAEDLTERRFTFGDISKLSSKAANFFLSLGIKKGDKVLLVMKRHWEFWPVFVALHKIGAVAIPATNQLLKKDFEYRINMAGVSAIVCTATGNTYKELEAALPACPGLKTKLSVSGDIEGWIPIDNFLYCSDTFERTDASPCGEDTAFMFFTSGTSGYPKIAMHSHKYAIGHFITARYWHCVDPDGLHITVSDTGWAKALWGKMYGQWMCEAPLFVYDMDRFAAADLLPMISKYGITTFCAPPTIYRMLIKEDISKYDLSSLKYITTAGEALNPEVSHKFFEATGLRIMEGFGQTETTLSVGTLYGTEPKL